MAFGFLKIASSVIGGITKFVKKQQAKKASRLDKKADAIANSKIKLAGLLGGGGVIGDTVNADTLGLKSLGVNLFNGNDVIKASAAVNSNGNASKTSVERGLTTSPSISASMSGMNPIIWIVAAIAAIFLLPKLLKK